jgi:hypothetical protein
LAELLMMLMMLLLLLVLLMLLLMLLVLLVLQVRRQRRRKRVGLGRREHGLHRVPLVMLLLGRRSICKLRVLLGVDDTSCRGVDLRTHARVQRR